MQSLLYHRIPYILQLCLIYFVKIRKLQEYLSKNISVMTFSELSMGTTADYEVAIQEGATYVRIGQGILGQRLRRN